MTAVRKAKRVARRYWRAAPPRLNDADTPRTWRRVRHFGLRNICHLCGARLARFLPAAVEGTSRPDALCPVCGSVEWYRLGWWFLSSLHGRRLQGEPRVLHVAAEPEIRRRFEAAGARYVAFDMDTRRASVVGDLQHLPFNDGAFDLVYCSHVLEHVTDDHMAVAELRRVVADSGAALIQVPITAEATWGDPTITDPEERLRLFGQSDHVRRYGYDFQSLLTAAGWKVERMQVNELPAGFVRRHGLPQHDVAQPAGDIFWCEPA